MISEFNFTEENIHYHLPVLALDADDTLIDTRGWFTQQAVSHGAKREKCLACPTLSLTDDMLPREVQNEALASAIFMKEAAPLPGAVYLLKALNYIAYPHFILTHRGYHPEGQSYTEAVLREYSPYAVPQIVALDTSVSKHAYLEERFTVNGRGNYVLCDDNTHCRRPDPSSACHAHDRWSRTVVVSQPWNVDAAFGGTRVTQVEAILKVLLQELHVFAEVRGSRMAKEMYKKLWHYIRTSPYTCTDVAEQEVREHRAQTLGSIRLPGVSI